MNKHTSFIIFLFAIVLSSCAIQLPAAGDLSSEQKTTGNLWILFKSDRDSASGYYMIPASGGETREIKFSGLSSSSITSTPIWSEKAGKFFFTAFLKNDTDIYSADWDGQNLKNLSHSPTYYEGEFALSPDLQSMAFIRASVNPSLAIMDLQTGETRNVLPEQIQATDPAWSADNQNIYFRSDKDGSPNILSVTVDGKKIKNVSKGVGLDASYNISSDGKMMAFDTDRDGNMDIYTLDLKTGEFINRSKDPARDTEPVISPDGNHILFKSSRDNGMDIYIVDLSDGTVSNLTQTPEIPEVGYLWSPDSQTVLFTAEVSGQQELFTLNIKDNHSTNVTNNPANDFAGVWLFH